MLKISKNELAARLNAPNSRQEIAPRIFAVRVFSLLEVIAIVGQADASGVWVRAVINANFDVDPTIRDAEILFEELHQPHARTYRERLDRVMADLAAAAAPGSTLTEVQLVRYDPGGKYAEHRDGPTPGATTRTLSIVCYLNDTFEGGETTFTELGISVSPLAGVAIAFPPELMHRAEPVITGRKYVITAWYHAPLTPGDTSAPR